jgi:ATP/maltotriose-dependent transcriptional regulator MalT
MDGDNGGPILRDAAEILYGMTLGRRGEIERAAEVALKFIQRTKLSHPTLTIPTMIPFLARIYLLQGRLRAAASLCREYLDPIQEKGARFIYSAGSLNIILGEVLYERNCLEEAERQIRDGLRANEPWSDIMTDAWGLSALARVLQAKGDSVGAMRSVDQFERRLHGHMRPREFEDDFHTLRVRMQIGSGDLQSAGFLPARGSLSANTSAYSTSPAQVFGCGRNSTCHTLRKHSWKSNR